MAHGNIYTAEKVDAALGNYFRVGNLTALRELALLWVAGRVDDQLERYRGRPRDRRDLGDPRAGRGRAHRRPRGRDADPPGRPDRRPHQRRRPAGRARRPAPTAWPAPTRRTWPAAARWSRASAAPTTRSSATTSRRRCWTSPGPRTPPSSCSAPSRRGRLAQLLSARASAVDRRSRAPAPSTSTWSPTSRSAAGRRLPRLPPA